MELNTKVTCDDVEYGNGEITFISSDGVLCLIKFENKDLNVMCSLSTNKTVHLDGKNNVKFTIEKTVSDKLFDLGINPEWIVVDDFCATLIKQDGNVDNIDDRVAFIEKTPRILIDGEWVSGPKGQGGSIDEDGETIYGFYAPSREWCEEELISQLGEK